MIDLKNKAFNEIFLAEISKFDVNKYANDIFFYCERERFSKIAREYGNRNGSGALSYMYNNFNLWKSGSKRMNITTHTKILSSTTATFTIEEKFIEAYTKLANHIRRNIPGKSQFKGLNSTIETILKTINTFSLERSSIYSFFIYKKDELTDYEEYVKQIFTFYTKIIFENFNSDLSLFVKAQEDINTAFMEVKFNTYLYNIEVNIQNPNTKLITLREPYKFDTKITYEDLVSNKLADFSLSKLSEIAKANNITKIDAFLTQIEIEKIVKRKQEIQNSKTGGTIDYALKTNSGVLSIKLRILSSIEKLLIYSRIILFILIITCLTYYCFILTNSYFIFTGGFIASLFLITPIYNDIVNLFKDTFKTVKNGR